MATPCSALLTGRGHFMFFCEIGLTKDELSFSAEHVSTAGTVCLFKGIFMLSEFRCGYDKCV